MGAGSSTDVTTSDDGDILTFGDIETSADSNTDMLIGEEEIPF
jgi:hypothetical protein